MDGVETVGARDETLVGWHTLHQNGQEGLGFFTRVGELDVLSLRAHKHFLTTSIIHGHKTLKAPHPV